MATNNQIADKSNYKLLPGIPAAQKQAAEEFNTIKNFQNAPSQQLTSFDDNNFVIDGTKSYSITKAITAATHTITAAASGHNRGNRLYVRYSFAQACTITLTNFDTDGNNTGTITPIKAGTYGFVFFANANGVNLEIPQNTKVLADQKTWYISKSGKDSNSGSSKAEPFLTIGKVESSATAGDVVIFLDTNATYSETVTLTKRLTFKGPASAKNTNTSIRVQITGTWVIQADDVTFNNLYYGASTSFDTTGYDVSFNDCYFVSVLSTRAAKLNFLNCSIAVGNANCEQLICYDTHVIGSGNFNIGKVAKLYNTTFDSNVNLVAGIDASSSCVTKNTTLGGNLTITGNLEPENTTIKGAIAISGTITGGNVFAGQSVAQSKIVSYSATPLFNLNNGNTQQMTLTGNITTFTVINPLNAVEAKIYLINDGTAGRTVAAPTGWTADASSETHTTAANAINLYQFYVLPDGTKYYNLYIVKA